MNARAMLLPTPLAIALSLAFAGSDSATTLGAEASGPSLHYALRMSQRAQRNALRVPAHGAFHSRPRAPADTLPVTSCADDGSADTLRSVIASASEGDVVDLSALDCSSITLTQGLIDLSVLGDHHINDLSIVAINQVHLILRIQFHDRQYVFRFNAAVLSSGLPGGAGVVPVLIFLNPNLRFGK